MFHLKMIKTVVTFSRYLNLSKKDVELQRHFHNSIHLLDFYDDATFLFPLTCCEGFIVNTINHYLYANCLTTYLGNLFVASTAKSYEYDHICGISHSFLQSCNQHQLYSLFIQNDINVFFIEVKKLQARLHFNRLSFRLRSNDGSYLVGINCVLCFFYNTMTQLL